MSYYAVAKGRTTGIFMNWNDCEAQVKGFSGARYKKFSNVVSAQEFINTLAGKSTPAMPSASQSNTKLLSSNVNNKLKRPYSTLSKNKHDNVADKPPKTKAKVNKPPDIDEDESETFTDEDDDLNAILSKQMDDIENRLKDFEKGVDKIIKKAHKNPSRKTIVIVPPQAKKKISSRDIEFEEDSNGYVHVYTDGACSSNGRNGARAGLGVYWGDGHALNISEPVSGHATNNCGEIQAATRAIKQALDQGIKKLAINTDSKFLINSATKWMPAWKQKGWKLKSGEPVKNEIDFKDLDSVQHKIDVKWNYVEAHRGVHGNEMADQLAKAGAAMYNK